MLCVNLPAHLSNYFKAINFKQYDILAWSSGRNIIDCWWLPGLFWVLIITICICKPLGPNPAKHLNIYCNCKQSRHPVDLNGTTFVFKVRYSLECLSGSGPKWVRAWIVVHLQEWGLDVRPDQWLVVSWGSWALGEPSQGSVPAATFPADLLLFPCWLSSLAHKSKDLGERGSKRCR